MTRTAKKRVKGHTYLYAERSFRLPSGKVAKAAKLIKEAKDAENETVQRALDEQEVAAHQKEALARYRRDAVLTEEKLRKLERYRVEYKRIKRRLSPVQRRDLIDRFSINFTYESNALEGNSLTLKDVTLILTEERLPSNKELREVYETRNTRAANDLLFANKVKLTIPSIRKLHRIVVEGTGVATGFKRAPNFLVMRDVQTARPERVQEELHELLRWLEESEEHPLKKAADFHARFERIHPFEDGNGRVGRILLNAILLKEGYPPLIIRKSARIAYLSALEAHDKGYQAKLHRFLLAKLEQSFEKFFQVYIEYL